MQINKLDIDLPICKLCGAVGPLRKSHIIPEFIYKPLYDNKHRMVGIGHKQSKNLPFFQKGLREPLLCDKCEHQLSRVESYACKALRRVPDTSAAQPGQVLIIHGIDYIQFKIFQLSVIWRAGVANNSSFSKVNLGPHEAKLREMVYQNDPGEPLEYPCLLISTRGPINGILKLFTRGRFLEYPAYFVIMGNLVWVYFVSSRTRLISQRNSFLSKSGQLPIHISGESATHFWLNFGMMLKTEGYV